MTPEPVTPTRCDQCPSFLTAEDSPQYFKKNIGTPMCAKFGHVLGKPGLKPVQEESILTFFAGGCTEAGKPRPINPPHVPAAQVTLGDPHIMVAGETLPSQQQSVDSCLTCKNYVRPEAVKPELGWPTRLCAASGRLLFPQLLSREAKNCNYRAPGANRTSTTGIQLMPVYEAAFNMDTDPISAFLNARRAGKNTSAVDPTEYPTDKPVSTGESKSGIRAWRKINSPAGTGKHVFLPIYDDAIFNEAESAKIPRTGDDEHPELFVDFGGHVFTTAVLWAGLDETPACWGIAGTGKTEFFRHMAWLMHLPFDRISVTASTDVDDLIGKMIAPDGKTVFQYGRLPKRWTCPGILLLDEPNTGPDEVWQTIRPLTDNSKQLAIDPNNGEILPRHADCYLGMAMNPAHDVRNVGANVLGDADGNRLMHLAFDLPPAAVEQAILEDRCALDEYTPSVETIKTVMAIAAEIRGLSDSGTLPISWGIRPQIKVLRATKWFGLMESYKLAITNYLEKEQAQAILDIVVANTSSAGA